MKRLLILTGLAVALSACETEVDLSDRPLFANGVNNLTLILYDGLTGGAITSAAVTLQVGPHRFEATHSGNIYSVTQIPRGTFLLTADASGYLGFTGEQAFTSTGNIINGSEQSFVVKNLVMYPTDSVADDIVVRLYDSNGGAEITQGLVVAIIDKDQAINSIVDDEITGTVAAGTGLRPSTISAEVGNNGAAVLPRGELVLGAPYEINVFNAFNAAGEHLVPVEGLIVRAGIDFPELVLFMDVPPATPTAVTASNEEDGTQDTLVVTFPYAVRICSDPANHSWFDPSGTDRDWDANATLPDPDVPATATLSNNDTELTLEFAIDPANNDQDDALDVQFINVSVQVQGASSCVPLSWVPLRDTGSNVSTTISVR